MGQVQNYKRKITYFYQYQNGKVGTTAGFLKLEIRGDKVKIIINIQEQAGLPYKEASLYFYHEAGDHLAAIKVDTVPKISGVLTYQTKTDWQQLFDTGRDLYTFDGVAVVYHDSHYYLGDFEDKKRQDYPLVLMNSSNYPAGEKREDKIITGRRETGPGDIRQMEMPEETGSGGIGQRERESEEAGSGGIRQKERESEETGSDGIRERKRESEETGSGEIRQKETEQREKQVQGDAEFAEESIITRWEDEVGKTVREKSASSKPEDAFDKMLAEYPKLPMYGATELFECVRIHPRDIGKLDVGNWKLGVNSFLTHGFYTYQYLMLGKMQFSDGKKHPVLGVPGIYSNREKYMANMFGFEQFVPVKKNGVKTGEFGYWIIPLNEGYTKGNDYRR